MLNGVYRWNNAIVVSLLCWYTHHPVIMAASLSGMVAAYSAATIIGMYGAIRILEETRRN